MRRPAPERIFRSHLDQIFRDISPGDAFILGAADNVMPDSLIERVAWVSEVLEKRGVYPLQ